jgi:transposase-like protein
MLRRLSCEQETWVVSYGDCRNRRESPNPYGLLDVIATEGCSFFWETILMEDLARFCCQNTACPKYGQRNAGNLTVSGRFGKGQQLRLLYCRTCKKRFSERKGTPLFGSKLPRPKLLSLLEHVAEGGGVRATSRLVRVHRDTVTHYTKACGEHARQLHDELVGFSPLDSRGSV